MTCEENPNNPQTAAAKLIKSFSSKEDAIKAAELVISNGSILFFGSMHWYEVLKELEAA